MQQMGVTYDPMRTGSEANSLEAELRALVVGGPKCLSRRLKNADTRFTAASINLLSPIPQPRLFRRDRGPDWEHCWKRSQSITR